MRPLCLLLSICFFFACNNSQNENSTPDQNTDTSRVEGSTGTVPAEPVDVSGCYLRVLVRDSFMARLQQNGDSVSGRLVFDNYEKDGSSGEVRGRIEDGVLKLVYSFESEGMRSVMDVYFKVRGRNLIRGIGQMQSIGDTAFFVNPDAIDYPAGDTLGRFPCESFPAKFR